MDSNRAQAYARALLQNTTDSLVKQLSAVRQGLRANPQLRQTLSDPTVEFRDKSAQIMALLPADAGPDVKRFLQFLLNEGAVDSLDEIIAELQVMASGGPRKTEAAIVSAVPLTDREKGELQRRISQEVGGDLEFDFAVDPELIGGMVVRVGDRIIDGSVSTKLRQLRESILKAL